MRKLLLGLLLSSQPLLGVTYRFPKVIPASTLTIPIIGEISRESLPLAGLVLAYPGNDIHMTIDSPGGSIFAMSAILRAMEHRKANGATITCIVNGMAASAAFTILTHCTKRIVIEHSYLLFHDARVILPTGTVVDRALAKELYEDLDRMYHSELARLLRDLPMDKDLVKLHYDNETFFEATELEALMQDHQWMEVYPALRLVDTP